MSDDDGYDFTISGLMRKRGELAAKADQLTAEHGETLGQLALIDNVLRLFDPALQIEAMPASAPPKAYASLKWQWKRSITSMLRERGAMTCMDIAKGLIAQRGLNNGDRRLLYAMQQKVGNALRQLRTEGLAVSEKGDDKPLVWRLL